MLSPADIDKLRDQLVEVIMEKAKETFKAEGVNAIPNDINQSLQHDAWTFSDNFARRVVHDVLGTS